MSDYFDIRERLRARYVAPQAKTPMPSGEALGGEGFLTEIAGRVILTAPAHKVSVAEELPKELAERWEQASRGNQFMLWLQGRFVEAEKANRNGAFWSTEDLQFGEMSVRHGPLNWLHEEQTIVGTIADNALIRPETASVQLHQAASALGYSYNATTDTYTSNDVVLTAEDVARWSTSANLFGIPQPRPYIAAVSAVWKWVHPEKAQAVERAADEGKLYYSMECIAREMSCVSDETHEGCGKSFDYVTAMTSPNKVCEHIAARSSARRMVDPSFLGGAVIVPPTQPGWGSANVEVIRQAASLAEQTHASAGDMSDSQWESLMQQVVRFATS